MQLLAGKKLFYEQITSILFLVTIINTKSNGRSGEIDRNKQERLEKLKYI